MRKFRVGGSARMHDGVDHAITLSHHLLIGKSENAIAARIQISRAHLVVRPASFGAMLAAIQLNDEFGAMTAEIGDVLAERRLAAKVQTNLFEIAQAHPQDAFGIRHVAAKKARKRVGHHPHPLRLRYATPDRPPRKGGG